MPTAAVKVWEVDGTPCLKVVATRRLAENEEIYLDLGYQLEVCMHDQVRCEPWYIIILQFPV